jgi:serine-type D-Ala-D-Ala carboxypeptidase (penicillin-binding protein 5/6)
MLQVSKNAATIGGTSAKLRAGDVLSVWDLLHGLMLPSGNDAAITLAEHFGQYLFEVATRYKSNKAGQQAANNGQTAGQTNTTQAAQVPPSNDADNQRRM